MSTSIVTLNTLQSFHRKRPDHANLSNSDLSTDIVPEQLWSLKSLKSLNLSGNSLDTIPTQLSLLTALTNLDLSTNFITKVSAEIFHLTTLVDLNLGRNSLSAVPSQLGMLVQLKYLNLMNNDLVTLPNEIGNLKQLYRLGLKSNQLRTLPESIGSMKSLVELFVTDNQLQALPDGMSGLHSLVKLQASFNQLKSLPAAMGQLPKLELMRVAVNSIEQVPTQFSGLQSLAWFSLAGNPACRPAPPIRSDIQPLNLTQLQVDTALGNGASGVVVAAKFEDRDVAMKIFTAETSPDGHARDEIAVTCHIDHPNLIKVIGIIDHPHALVLERVWGSPLALKPNFESLLRCRWQPGQTFTLDFVMNVAIGVANALEYLHQHNICHGDVYAHNVLADSHGKSVLCDYGASYFYQADQVPYQQQEVRAYGLLLKDLASRTEMNPDAQQAPECATQKSWPAVLLEIVHQCVDCPDVLQRLTFRQIVQTMQAYHE